MKKSINHTSILPGNYLGKAVILEDYREYAKSVLPRTIFDYIDGWAGDGVTNRANLRDFDRIMINPLVMRNVDNPNVSTSYLGRSSVLPIGFSPSAFHRLVHPDGELATARAAQSSGIPMIVSAMSSESLEDIAHHANRGQLWLHTYLFRNREITRELVMRAEVLGFEAISLGFGCPVMGKRYANIRNCFTLPDGVEAANFSRQVQDDFNNPISSLADAEIDPSATWDDVAEFCQKTSLPVVGKGLMNRRDVRLAFEAGIKGVMVSNHGGRQLDTTLSTIKVLPEIAEESAGRGPVFLDGGVRRGTDVLKALALGADGIFLGRPVLWALCSGGAEGVIEMVAMLVDELRRSMQLAGCNSLVEARQAAPDLLRLF